MSRNRSQIIWHVYSSVSSPFWWAWKHNPKPPPQRIRRSTHLLQRQYTREEASRLINPGNKPQYPSLSLAWFEEYLLGTLKLENVTRNTVYVYYASLKYLIEIFGPNYSIQNIDRTAIDKYKSYLLNLKKSPVTVNDYLKHLRAAFERLIIDNKIDRNPFFKFKPLKETRKSKALTLLELREFLKFAEQYASPDLYHLIRIYAGTGRRRNEILYLKREDVDLEKGLYYPVNIKSKEKVQLVRSIPDNLMDDFKYFLNHDHAYPFAFWSEDTITHRVTALFKAAGFEGYSLHSLRHTYLTILNDMNYSVRQAQRIIDHSNIQITTRYFHDDVLQSPNIGI